MAIWLIRAGSHGEYEQKFITENRVYVTWERLGVDISKLFDRDALFQEMSKLYDDAKPKQLLNWASQVWHFCHDINKGDLVVLPLKTQPAIQIGEITGDYHFQPGGPDPFFHWRPVKWIGEAIPRSNFGQDLRYTFGAFLTICRVQRNNADARITAMRAAGWKAETLPAAATGAVAPGGETPESADLEELARDQVTQLIAARFKGHALARLVEAILKAQGYTTYRSPEMAEKRLVFQPVNYDKPENAHFLKDYKLPCPSLVVVRRKAGKDAKWKLLDKTWEHVENPFKFNEYVEGEVEEILRETK